ncbi:MAG: hypothetical protein LBM08_15880, partial [Dysgonamonadaceae bacterium]|nr:hypothetical protein [Dysgonamonadaceae bacterium]
MKQRKKMNMIARIKKTSLYAVIFFTGCTGQTPTALYELDYTPPVDLEAGFAVPPDYAKAGAFWMWLEGNASKEGILSDLTEMK